MKGIYRPYDIRVETIGQDTVSTARFDYRDGASEFYVMVFNEIDGYTASEQFATEVEALRRHKEKVEELRALLG